MVLESPISLGQWAARSIEVARASRLLVGRRKSSEVVGVTEEEATAMSVALLIVRL
jgi:hypothetical protein